MNITQLIKTAQRVVKQAALATPALVLILAPAAHAATRTKQNNTDNLNLASSWDTLPGASDIAQWTSTVAGPNTTVLGADLSWAGIKVVSPGGLVTINAGNTLTVGASGIDLSAATQDLTLNCGLTLQGKQSWKAAASRTLNVAGTFTHTGAVVDVTSFNAAATLSGIANDASGILGPWATTGTGTGNTLNYVKSTSGAISAFTTQTPATAADMSNVTDANVNYSLTPPSTTVSSTLTGPISANTLRVTSSMTGDTTPAIANAGNSITLNGLIGVGTGRTRISGTGNLVIGATKELVVNWTVGQNAILCPIIDNPAGASSVTIHNVAGGEDAWGVAGVTSTYTGGTVINATTSFQLNFYTGDAFGTGPITLNGLAVNSFHNRNSSVVSNSITINAAGSRLRLGTFAGPIMLNANINTCANISGNISGAGGVNQDTLVGPYTFSGTNTYTGPTTVSVGTLKAGRASVPDVSGAFGLNSAVTMVNVAATFLDLNGFDTQIGSLTGGGATGGIVTNSHATTAVTLTVGGNNTSPATFAGRILGPRLSLRKIGSGTLTLSGANTYSNSTIVSAGTLSVSNSVFADGADVRLYTGGTLSLNYSGTDNIRSLYTNGVGVAAGEWGSPASGAANQSALFTGTGKLNVFTLGTATFTNSISGTVTTNGVGLAGVTVSAGAQSAITALDGTYTITGVPDGATYTVTPNNYRYSFEQPSLPVTVSGGDIAGKNFTATLLPPQGMVILLF